MILAFGISHKTAPVAVRERLAFSQSEIPNVLSALQQQCHAKELVVLSTCNRTEFYGLVSESSSILKSWFALRSLEDHSVQNFLYQHQDIAAVRHLMRVASGLDSMVLGEPQILSQLKTAYGLAHHAGSLGRHLQRLFQKSFMVAKQVRTQTAIGQHPVSVAYAAVKLAKQIFNDLAKARVLMIGAGETIELVAQHLKAQGVKNEAFANRSLERAQQLALAMQGNAMALPDLQDHLADYDIIISAVASPEPILKAPQVEAALKKRKRHPVFMLDLGIPRNIDGAVGEHEDVYLYNLDDLQQVVDDNLGNRQQESLLAETIIARQSHEFMNWLQAEAAIDVLKLVRSQAQSIEQEAVAKALKELKSGQEPEKVIKCLAHRMRRKLLHHPSIRLKEAGEKQDEDLVRAAAELFLTESS